MREIAARERRRRASPGPPTTEERNRLWRARHNAYFAVRALRPGTRAQTTDVCVPVSELAACIAESAADARELSFPAAMVGHVADGNFHWICPVDMDSESERAELAGFVDRMVDARDRRRRHVHGRARRRHRQARAPARRSPGPAVVAAMRALKTALDPGACSTRGRSCPTELSAR